MGARDLLGHGLDHGPSPLLPQPCRCTVLLVTRFVVDCETLLRIAAGEIEVAAEHQLVAPTLVRSQALSALYEAARHGEITRPEGPARGRRVNPCQGRFFRGKGAPPQGWRGAGELG